MDGMLSQEEINALLSGMGSDSEEEENATADNIEAGDAASASEASETGYNSENFLTDIEKDILGEISNISMGTAATTLSSLVNQKVDISIPTVSYTEWDELVQGYARPCVFLEIKYKEGLDGDNILILKDDDVKIIADLMMGGDGSNTDRDLDELCLSAICEAMNQMMGSAATSLSSMMSMKIDISPPVASLVDLNEELNEEELSEFLQKGFVRNSFRMTIGDLVDSEMMQLFPVEFAKELCTRFMDGSTGGQAEEPAKEPEPTPSAAPPESNHINMPDSYSNQQMNADQMQQNITQGAYPPNAAGYNMNNAVPQGMNPAMMPYPGMPYPGMPYPGVAPAGMQGYPQANVQPVMQEVNVQPAQFQEFSGDLAAVTQKENINLIMDVPLEVSVELGRTSKSIQDILEFSPGTIIELDKIAGEPIDVLVNGKYVAKGEVVVIEESFGVRVTEIIK